jgi:ABC-type multidrug transport system fused ATPase/permease subunit
MLEVDGIAAGKSEIGIFRRIFWGFIYSSFAMFALAGVLAVAATAYFVRTGTVWSPADVERIMAPDSATMVAISAGWQGFKFFLQYGAYFLAALALFVASTHIKTVSQLMRDFLSARGAIYQLTATMTTAEETAARLSAQADRLSQLEPTIKEMSEKVEETVLRIGDLQRLSVSERVDGPPVSDGLIAGMTAGSAPAADDDNWEKLRELWNANGARLDLAIERIPDKRKRSKFSRMDRRNYTAIINGLADDGFISQAARDGSLKVNSTFMTFRTRSRPVPDHVIADMQVADHILEQEFGRELEPAKTDRRTPPVEKVVPATV